MSPAPKTAAAAEPKAKKPRKRKADAGFPPPQPPEAPVSPPAPTPEPTGPPAEAPAPEACEDGLKALKGAAMVAILTLESPTATKAAVTEAAAFAVFVLCLLAHERGVGSDEVGAAANAIKARFVAETA